jgi:dihydroneopterin aldolase
MIEQKLKIQDYEVSVNLGCSDKEQKYLQHVRFTLEIQYLKNVKGALTDNLHEATDYSALTEIIKKIAKQKKYHLIEHLNYQVFEALLAFLRGQNVSGQIELSIHKINVPIENLKNGAVFSCSTKI